MEARQLEAQARFTYGEISRAQGNPREALEHYGAGQQVLEALGDPELGWRIAYGQGQALETLGRDQDAVGAYRRAADIIEEVRSQLAEERYRAGYIEDKYQVYVALVRLQLKMGRLGEAFPLPKNSVRAITSSYFIVGCPRFETPCNVRQSSSSDSGSATFRERSKRNTGRKPRSKEGRPSKLFLGSLLAPSAPINISSMILKRTDLSYASARMLVVPSTEQVQRSLAPQTALIEYVVGGESVSILVLTSERMFATSVPLSAADLRAKVELLRVLIAREGSSEWQRPAKACVTSSSSLWSEQVGSMTSREFIWYRTRSSTIFRFLRWCGLPVKTSAISSMTMSSRTCPPPLWSMAPRRPTKRWKNSWLWPPSDPGSSTQRKRCGWLGTSFRNGHRFSWAPVRRRARSSV